MCFGECQVGNLPPAAAELPAAAALVVDVAPGEAAAPDPVQHHSTRSVYKGLYR